MKPLLRNPVYHSLLLNDRHLGFGPGKVLAFNETVSPFAGFEEGDATGFEELFELLPNGRTILYATPQKMATPDRWKLLAAVEGLQFVFEEDALLQNRGFNPVALTEVHVPQMMALATLTKPGPFGPRTIDFGHYYGVFQNEQLVAMTGQRLHVEQYTEISAVCTHPDFLGKGYATALVQHQTALILNNNQVPFLHVRADNLRAIEVYKRLHFMVQGPMNFYFLKKEV